MRKKIEKFYEQRDLEALKKMAVPQKRTQNRDQGYASVLMLSAHNIKHLFKIEELDADAIMLNLEDGVAKEEKPFATVLAALTLQRLQQCKKKLIVRVNALDEGGEEEIGYLNAFYPDAIRIPKVKSPSDVQRAVALLDPSIELHLSVETADAWHRLRDLRPSHQVKAFYLGVLDLFADMGLPQSLIQPDNPTMQTLLGEFLLTSRALGVKPVSFVFQEYKDTASFEAWLSLEKRMGYDAKGCIAPQQVALVNRFFKVSDEEIRRAEAIVTRFEAEQKQGVSGFVDERYGFIDEPIYKGACKLLGRKAKL